MFHVANFGTRLHSNKYIPQATWLTVFLHLGLSTVIYPEEALSPSQIHLSYLFFFPAKSFIVSIWFLSLLPCCTRHVFLVCLSKIESKCQQSRVAGLLVNPVPTTEPNPHTGSAPYRALFVWRKSNDYLQTLHSLRLQKRIR